MKAKYISITLLESFEWSGKLLKGWELKTEEGCLAEHAWDKDQAHSEQGKCEQNQ
jgi:hypothetical protein